MRIENPQKHGKFGVISFKDYKLPSATIIPFIIQSDHKTVSLVIIRTFRNDDNVLFSIDLMQTLSYLSRRFIGTKIYFVWLIFQMNFHNTFKRAS